MEEDPVQLSAKDQALQFAFLLSLQQLCSRGGFEDTLLALVCQETSAGAKGKKEEGKGAMEQL